MMFPQLSFFLSSARSSTVPFTPPVLRLSKRFSPFGLRNSLLPLTATCRSNILAMRRLRTASFIPRKCPEPPAMFRSGKTSQRLPSGIHDPCLLGIYNMLHAPLHRLRMLQLFILYILNIFCDNTIYHETTCIRFPAQAVKEISHKTKTRKGNDSRTGRDIACDGERRHRIIASPRHGP